MHLNYTTTYKNNPDKLIADFNDGDIEAFHYIFKEYYRGLVFFARRILLANQLAEDIVQDMFIKLLDRNENFHSLSAIKVFLYLSVINSCLDHKKHDKIVEHYQNEQHKEENEESDFEQQIIETESIRLIHKAMEELPPQCQKIFRMGLKGFKNQEIADELKISINTVKTQKKRALVKLRKELGDGLIIFMLINSTYFLK